MCSKYDSTEDADSEQVGIPSEDEHDVNPLQVFDPLTGVRCLPLKFR